MSPPAQGDGILGDAAAKKENSASPQPSGPAPSRGSEEPKPSTESRPGSAPAEGRESASSKSSVKDEKMIDAVPYGTRSRNRPGASRPNYAEDFDDFDVRAPAKSQVIPSKRTSPSDAPAKEGNNSSTRGEASSSGQRGAAVSSIEKSASPFVAEPSGPERKRRKPDRGQTPKASTPSGNVPNASVGADEAPVSRKRKAAETSRGLSKASTSAAPPSAGGKASFSSASRRNCIVTFEKSGARLNKHGKIKSDDGEEYAVDDHIYGVCEPPGEPYYLARIMQFRHSIPDDPTSPVRFFLVNWFYRPKDVQKYSIDSRLLFASMHSDEIPVTSLRGKCRITHRSEIKDLEEYRKVPNSFWYSQMYDRYIQKPYELIPASAVKNVPDNIKKAIDERWRFLIVEAQRYKEFTSDVKTCKKCSKYCAPNETVECGVCRDNYHMSCVKLERKPTRGFAWSCLACSRAHDRKNDQRLAKGATEEDREHEEDVTEENTQENGVEDEDSTMVDQDITKGNQAEIEYAGLWHWRYLGIHCAIEDVLQYDDRAIYPRAASRQGPKYQAFVVPWYGHAVELVKPSETKKKLKGAQAKKDLKAVKDTASTAELEKQDRTNRPKWMQDEPSGYVARGEDYPEDDPRCTAFPISVIPNSDASPSGGFSAVNANVKDPLSTLDQFMDVSQKLAAARGAADAVQPRNVSTNYLDKTLSLLTKHKFDAMAALNELRTHHSPRELKNPEFTKEELKRFEDGVRKHGSDLRSVRKHVKTKSHGDIVRFYYTWKWTPRGKEIWGSYEGRRRSKRANEASWPQLADDEDDSAFDGGKATAHKQRFQCKFCKTSSSKQWRRAPMVQPGQFVYLDPASKASNKEKLAVALCERCAISWRRYAVQFTDLDELIKSMTQPGGRAWKRRTEEDLLRELLYANYVAGIPVSAPVARMAQSMGCPYVEATAEQTNKKVKTDKESTPTASAVVEKKKVAVSAPRPPTPPPVPDQPQLRKFPCAICLSHVSGEPTDQLVSCKECRLTVHRRCYGISEQTRVEKWACDTCMNDKNNVHSLNYECVLCSVANRKPDLIEPPKPGPKKKTERDREKERLEKELANQLLDSYKKSQVDRRRPTWPREALKPTASHNWVHISCAIWVPDVKFRDSEKLDIAEGTGSVLAASSRSDQVCKLCHKNVGASISCHQCHAPFHVECAHDAGYHFGFDITPVKSTRKDLVHAVTIGEESGAMTAAVWCKEHQIKGIFHPMTEVLDETGFTSLQLFVQTYKQADISLSGTARKANLLVQSAKAQTGQGTAAEARRRSSLLVNGLGSKGRKSPPPEAEEHNDSSNSAQASDKRCVFCGTSFSIRFHWTPTSSKSEASRVNGITNGDGAESKGHALEMVPPNRWQCHKCFMGPRAGLEPVTSKLDDDELQPDGPLPDYFDIMFPGCRSYPLHVPPPTNGHPINPQQAVRALARVENGNIPPRGDDLRHCETVLWSCHIHIRNPEAPKGFCDYIFSGREFGSLEKEPGVQFNDVKSKARANCHFNEAVQVMRTDDNILIDSPKKLMEALVNIIRTGPRQAEWSIVRTTDPFPQPSPTHQPPPPWPMNRPSSYHQHASPERSEYPPPHPAPPHLQTTIKFGPPPRSGPPPLAPGVPRYSPPRPPPRPHVFSEPPSYLAATPGQPSPFFTHPHPHPHPPLPHGSPHGRPPPPPPPPGAARSLSPNDRRDPPPGYMPGPPHGSPHTGLARPVTPKELASSGAQPPRPPFTGASSSPNVKNLVH